MNRVFEAAEISKAFGALQVLDSVSLQVRPGETLGLLGPNGAGKTTLINIIAGYEKQDGGLITLDDKPLDEFPPFVRARMGIARTFQAGRLFPQLSVAENVALGALGLGESKKIARSRSDYVLNVLGIGQLAGSLAGGLSHGSARMVGLARALAGRPKYLIMDEPAAGLNEHEVPTLLSALEKVRQETGCGMLLVEHNVALVTKACSRVVVLAAGAMIFDGSPSDALNDAGVKNAYLGDAAFRGGHS
jgi:branched-chain amino acid transport system ATP-binding protein